MTRHRLPRLAAALTILLASATVATAQSREPEQPANMDAARTIDLTFRGGTAADYVEALRATRAPVNLVVLNDISRVKMPTITLKRVAIESAVALLENVTDSEVAPTVVLSIEHMPRRTAQATDVFTIRAHARSAKQRSPLRTSVISVRDLLDGDLRAADMLTAIETALEQLQDDFSPADVKFHEATGLLICRGHAEQINAIEQVVGQLQEARDHRVSLREREAMIEEFAARVQVLETELLAAQNALAQAERALQASRRELDEAQGRFNRERGTVIQLQNENQSLVARINDLERQIKRSADGVR